MDVDAFLSKVRLIDNTNKEDKMIKQNYFTVQGNYGEGWEDIEDFPKSDPNAQQKADELKEQLVLTDDVPYRVIGTRK